MPTVHEHFSRQFQKWEVRGRGWQVFDQPVYPEPPFTPFAYRSMTETPAVDDGRRHTFLSSLMEKVSQKLAPPAPSRIQPEPEEDPQPVFLNRGSMVELQAALPADFDISRDSFEHLFRNLALCREPLAFELVGSYRRVLVQFAACEEDISLVRKQLQAILPDVQFRQQTGTLKTAWMASNGNQAIAVEFGLEQEFVLPLANDKLDPFVGIVAALAELQPSELAMFQVIFQPVQNPWAESIVNAVTGTEGKPLFVNSPELTGAAENKVARPLFAAVVRIMARTTTRARLYEIARDLAGSLRVFANPQGNALIPLKNNEYPYFEHLEDVIARRSRRIGMILNSDELASFVHLPSSDVRSPALQRDSGRTKAAPAIVQNQSGIVIGDNEHNGETVEVCLNPDQRVRHTHIIGSNGTGKSSLLLNMILQDIKNGDGVAVLDPHGDLIDQILGCIPEDRINDVVLVDLADEEFPIGFNLLQAHTETERRLLASDLVGVFRRLSRSWGDNMDSVLQNAILVFLKSSQGGTLADLRRFLRDKDFRREFLLTVRDPELIDFWQSVAPTLGVKAVNSLLARLQEFFSKEPLRNMVSQRKKNLNFSDIMDSRKIFLAKLSTGMGGDENSYLLGTLLVSKFQQLAMARQEQKIEDRKYFWLYIDEFQHFISPSMELILNGTRKYKFGFTLAHQNLHQLQADTNVASAVMTQPCTRIVLGVGDDDAKRLGECFDSFDAKSLTRLEKFHAIVRVGQNDFDFNLALRKPELSDGEERKAAVIAASRTRYATPRADVEEALLAEIRPKADTAKPPEPPASEIGASKPSPKPVTPLPQTSLSVVPKVPVESNFAEIRKAAVYSKLQATESTGSEIKDAPTAKPASPAAVISPPDVKTNAEVQNSNQTEAVSADAVRQHESLKNEITAEAESLDFTVSPETSIPQHGRIDLILTRGNKSIACEISVTTTPKTEADHIRLRLKAGFKHVAVISANRRKLNLIQAAFVEQCGSNDVSKVGFYVPKEFFAQLFTWAADDPEGGKIEKGKPKKQIFNFNPSPEDIANRAEEEREMLDDLTTMMKRNKTG